MNVQLAAAWGTVCAAVAAVWALRRREGAARRARLLMAEEGRSERVPKRIERYCASLARTSAVLREHLPRATRRLEARLGVRIGPEALCLPAGTAVALAARSPVPLLAAAVAVPCLGRRLRAREARAAHEEREEAVAALCAAVAGELRAGRSPEVVLTEAVERLREAGPDTGAGTDTDTDTDRGTGSAAGWSSLTPLLAAARFGGDVPAALRHAALRSGASGLAAVAACWEVAVDKGAGLADGLDRVAASLRSQRAQRDELRGQLAGPKATAVMLALLPAFGVLLGVSLGADPLRVLFRTPVGLVCLAAGVVLEWAGLAWTARIVRSAEGAP